MALYVTLIPNLPEAIHTAQADKEQKLKEFQEAVVAQHIEDLTMGYSLVMKCAIWIHGTPEALQTLKDYLTAENISFEEHTEIPAES